MFVAISHREAPLINTENVLLADIPQSSQWTFASEPSDVVGSLVEIQKEDS